MFIQKETPKTRYYKTNDKFPYYLNKQTIESVESDPDFDRWIEEDEIVPIIIRGSASATANLSEWVNSNRNTVLFEGYQNVR